MPESHVLSWIGLAVFGGNVFGTVRARNISGIVVMADVRGDVTQRQAQEPPEPPRPKHHEPKNARPESEDVGRNVPALPLQSFYYGRCR